MSSVALLLNTPLRILSLFFFGVVKRLVDAIVIPALDYYNKGHDDSEEKDSPSLFPKTHNVDKSLFESASVIPCSMDIGSMESPMTMSMTPEGNFQCKLNNANEQVTSQPANKYVMITPPNSVDENGLPVSPESNTSSKEEETIKNDVSEEADKDGHFVCHYCDAKFKIRGYLTRHIKKHAIQKAYHCPFFLADVPPELRCHNSGGFSRRDTYKTHLRTRHFIYPRGVKPQDRSKSSGNCAQCGQKFENTDRWVELHIESGECRGLPQDYVRNIKSERKSGKLKMIKTSTGHSRFISTAQSVVEAKVLLNKDALEAMAIVAHNTNRSDILSRYGNNKILMNSANFKGEPKPKKKYARRKPTNAKKNDSAATTPATLPSLEESPMRMCYNYDEDNTVVDSSLIPSPEQNQSLEPIPSASSESSHECHAGKSENIIFNDPFSIPLDMEQSPQFDLSEYNSSNSPTIGVGSGISINETLKKQMDPVLLGEAQLRELEQYTDFYKHTFGYNL